MCREKIHLFETSAQFGFAVFEGDGCRGDDALGTTRLTGADIEHSILRATRIPGI
jgi:hypothetical protein